MCVQIKCLHLSVSIFSVRLHISSFQSIDTRGMFLCIFVASHFAASHKSARYSGSMNCSAQLEWVSIQKCFGRECLHSFYHEKICSFHTFKTNVCVREYGMNFIWQPHCAWLFQKAKTMNISSHITSKTTCIWQTFQYSRKMCTIESFFCFSISVKRKMPCSQLQNSVCRQSA